MFDAETAAFRRTFVLSRPTVRATLAVAAVYTAQVAVCVLVLAAAYRHVSRGGAMWAVISAVLALQPSREQSVVTSVVRIVANTVGAGVGLIVGELFGAGTWQIIATIAVVVPTCELLRLNLALRTACVAAIIVLTVGTDAHGRGLVSTGEERFVATVAGCGMALCVQVVTDVVRRAITGRSGEANVTQS